MSARRARIKIAASSRVRQRRETIEDFLLCRAETIL
jgi:hypothetical protein